jgi:hypothetical protein
MTRITDYFLLRVAGLPFAALAAVASDQTLSHVKILESLEEKLLGERASLCDELHQLAAGQSDAETRLRLIKLKRCIYNLRLPPPEASAIALAETLFANAPLQQRLREWEAAIGRYQEARRCGEITLRDEIASIRRRLQVAWSSEQFQTGLLMTNPVLYNDLLQYLSNDLERPSKKLRRFEQTALTYFYRMATKTSPFSTYMFTGVGIFAGRELLLRGDEPQQWRSAFTLNAAIATQLYASLCARRESSLGLKLNETTTRRNGAFLFLQRKRNTQRPDRVDVHETFSSVDASEPIELVFDLFRNGAARLTLVEISESLQAKLGSRAEPESLRAFVSELVACGFLTPALEYEANHPQGLKSLGQAAAACLNGLGQEVQATANQIEDMIGQLSAQDISAQAKTLSSARAGVSRLAETIRLDFAAGYAKDLVRQDCHFNSIFELSPAALGNVSEGLKLLTRIMPIFNTGYLLQRLLRNYFRERYGAASHGIPLTQFLTDFYSECYQPVMGAGEEAVWDPYLTRMDLARVPEVAAMAKLRERFIGDFRKQIEAVDGTAQLSPEFFKAYELESSGYWTNQAPLGVGYLGQPFREHDESSELSFVLNQVLSGYGTYLARYCDKHTFGSPAELLSQRVAGDLRTVAKGYEFAEIIATFGLNFQIHVPLTNRSIVYPFESTLAGNNERIEWSDLNVEFDEASDSAVLVSKSNHTRVLPLRMGPLSPHLMPVPYKILTSLGPLFVPDFSLLHILEYQRKNLPGAVYRYPRVRLGNLILLRESWRVPPERVPRLETRDSELGAFLRVRRWARDLDLPARVFVVPMEITEHFESAGASGAGTKETGNMRRLYKPFLVDFDSPVSCRIFQRLTEKGNSTMTVSEMLPTAAQNIFTRKGEHYAAELLLECYSSN